MALPILDKALSLFWMGGVILFLNLPRKAFRTFDPIRSGLPPLELQRQNPGGFVVTEVFWQTETEDTPRRVFRLFVEKFPVFFLNRFYSRTCGKDAGAGLHGACLPGAMPSGTAWRRPPRRRHCPDWPLPAWAGGPCQSSPGGPVLPPDPAAGPGPRRSRRRPCR